MDRYFFKKISKTLFLKKNTIKKKLLQNSYLKKGKNKTVKTKENQLVTKLRSYNRLKNKK